MPPETHHQTGWQPAERTDGIEAAPDQTGAVDAKEAEKTERLFLALASLTRPSLLRRLLRRFFGKPPG